MSGFMLASPTTGASNRTPITPESLGAGWAFDLKIDGIRCQAHLQRRGYPDTPPDGGPLRAEDVTLTNRNKVDITSRFPDVVMQMVTTFKDWRGIAMLLDGEILAVDGTFSTTATRDKNGARADSAAQAHPCLLTVFDVLLDDDGDLARLPWAHRRIKLDDLENTYGLRVTPYSMDLDFLDFVKDAGGEGVIAKRVTSNYVKGRSKDWLKFKNTHSVTCLVTGYEPGNGSRKDFGAMQLVMIGGGNLVPVGRVGTGFTERTIASLKASLDNHEVLVVEIECLNVTKDRQLRFPVFKGLRTDVHPIDCTIDQLDTIPTY